MADSDTDDPDFLLRIRTSLPQDNTLQREEEEEQQQQCLSSSVPKQEPRSEETTTSKHHLSSINETLVTHEQRQLGLSYQLWPAASTLLTLLDTSPSTFLFPTSPSPLRILELGSGTGLAGIASAALLSAHVTLTDLPHVLPNLHRNALLNAPLVSARGGRVSVLPLPWGSADDLRSVLDAAGGFDVVLAADVVYYEELVEPLLRTAVGVVRGGVPWVLAHLKRWRRTDAVFFRKARKVFDVEVLHRDSPRDGSRTGVIVYRLVEKKGRSRGAECC